MWPGVSYAFYRQLTRALSCLVPAEVGNVELSVAGGFEASLAVAPRQGSTLSAISSEGDPGAHIEATGWVRVEAATWYGREVYSISVCQICLCAP